MNDDELTQKVEDIFTRINYDSGRLEELSEEDFKVLDEFIELLKRDRLKGYIERFNSNIKNIKRRVTYSLIFRVKNIVYNEKISGRILYGTWYRVKLG